MDTRDWLEQQCKTNVATMSSAMHRYLDRQGMYVMAFNTNRIAHMTYIWKLRVERGLEDKK